MKTLVATAEPPNSGSLPKIMIVDSTPWQRFAWDEQCRKVGVSHHFVDVKGGVRRLKEGYPVVGVILDADMLGGHAVTHEQLYFLNKLKGLGYKGPLVGANLHPEGPLRNIMRHMAEDMGCSLFLDEDGEERVPYADMLQWCLNH